MAQRLFRPSLSINFTAGRLESEKREMIGGCVSFLKSSDGGNQNVNVNVAMKSTISGGDIRSVANGEQITQDSGYASLIGGALS